jgi:hypothetical protein
MKSGGSDTLFAMNESPDYMKQMFDETARAAGAAERTAKAAERTAQAIERCKLLLSYITVLMIVGMMLKGLAGG